MCKHTYSYHGETKKCDVNETLGIDGSLDDKGFCILHSKSKEWKFKNKCFELFTKYINEKNSSDQSIKFYDIYVIGQQPKGKKLQKMFDGDVIYFKECTIDNDIEIYDSIFQDEIYLDHVVFNGNVVVYGTTFNGAVEIVNSNFKEDLEIGDKCEFKKPFSFGNVTTYEGPISIIGCIFHDSFDLDGAECQSGTIISGNDYLNEDESVQFTADFRQGFSFDSNNIAGLLNFQECDFYGDSEIINVPRQAGINMQECQLYGSLLFKGSESNLMFGPNSNIEIEESQFHNVARMTFDYCDILSLKDGFITKARDLIELEKVKLNGTCKVNLFIRKYTYEIRDINENIIRDYITFLTRYFSHLFHTSLDVRYERLINESKLITTFSSAIDLNKSFEKDFPKTMENLTREKFTGNEDLYFQLSAIKYRLNRNKILENLETSELDDMLSLKDIENKIIYPLNFKIFMNNPINQISVGTNNQQTINSGIIVNADGIDKVTKMADKVKDELTQKEGFTPEELRKACEIIDDIMERYGNGQEIKSYQKDTLLSMAGSTASIVSFFDLLLGK